MNQSAHIHQTDGVEATESNHKVDSSIALLRSIDSSEADYAWVEQSLKYAAAGQVHPDCLVHILHQLEWAEIHRSKPIYAFLKRGFDIIVSGTLLVLTLPIFILAGVAITLESKGPAFFSQYRIGRGFQAFRILKFRTMMEDAERQVSFMDSYVDGKLEALKKHSNDWRVTRVGNFLRKWKIDELPQLVNVLKGDMSLVGPRPLSIDDTSAVDVKYFTRFGVTPGMSGMWQARLPVVRDGLEKIKLDCEYVKMRSFNLDMKLLFKTAFVMIRGEY